MLAIDFSFVLCRSALKGFINKHGKRCIKNYESVKDWDQKFNLVGINIK